MKQKCPEGLSNSQNCERIHKLLFAYYDGLLDDAEDDTLRDPRIASMIRSNLYHHHGKKYYLLGYCVMPNHVHVLFQPIEHDVETSGTSGQIARASTGERPVTTLAIGEQPDKLSPLANIMHSLKSYTAHEANKILKRTGTFWQPESYDHWVRDDEELERIVLYIRGNPVKARFVPRPENWYWCSCHDRYLVDGDTSAWLVASGGSPGTE